MAVNAMYCEDAANELYDKLDNYYDKFNIINNRFDVISTRFTSNTYLELYRYKHQKGIENQSIYGVKTKIGQNINIHKYLFVLEMNNTINKIVGIGMIKNLKSKNQDIQIYNDSSLNNHIYTSSFHIQLIDPTCINNYTKSSLTRNKVPDIYCENIPPEFIDLMEDEIIPNCFFGKGHIKRGGGFTRYPLKFQKPSILKKLIKLFIILNPNNFNKLVKKRLLKEKEEKED